MEVFLLLEPEEGVGDEAEGVTDIIAGVFDSEEKAIAKGLDLTVEEYQFFLQSEMIKKKQVERWGDGTIYVNYGKYVVKKETVK